MRIRRMEDQIRLFASTMSQLFSPICEELPSQTIINLKKDKSAITLTSAKELQDSQEEASTYAVEKDVEKKEIKPQPQIVQ